VFAAERLQRRRTGTLLQFWKWGMVEWFFLTFALGAVFVSGQVFEYANLVSEHIGFTSDAYGSAFYLTTGFHALHVTGA
jgi:Heme/copper-type cytochrome/quinol oxidase, subunit 3